MANRRNRTEVIARPVPAHVMAAIQGEIVKAEARREAMRLEMKREEDQRAWKRNWNRIWLLVLTIVNTFVATNVLNGVGLHGLIVRYPTTPVALGFLFDLVFVIIATRRKI